ncbi:efflux RND transporter periplasmic adaptor subunit [Saccharicrinis sp. 156]|uniref:efflux RND transporter periplasmic adaptor subunit n=1 Tax=Saccharicrinis sp. 156 TaxID=3417574 RepID=UPI003D3464A9
MKKRIITIGISLLIVLGTFMVLKALPKNEGEAKGQETTTKNEGMLVEVMYAEQGTVEHSYKATGKLTAFDRYEIYAQVSGQILSSARNFREGKSYTKGEVMLEIDQREYEMTVLAQKSTFITLITSILPDLKSDYPDAYTTWRKYVSNIDVNAALKELPEVKTEQLKFYLAGKSIYSTYYNILSAEEKLAKYTIRAPFDGVVTSAVVDAGTAVNNGSQLGTLVSTSSYDLEITVPLSLLGNVKIGTEAVLTSTELSGQWQGKVVRIGGDIDEQTQSLKLFIRTSGKDLKESMFLTAELEQQPYENAMSLPRKMVDDDNNVFVVENGELVKKQLNVLARKSDIAIVKGLEEGTPVLSTVVKSAYDGMKVRIAN